MNYIEILKNMVDPKGELKLSAIQTKALIKVLEMARDMQEEVDRITLLVEANERFISKSPKICS